jgi:hypothetical protein
MSAAAEPSTFATTIELILKTLPDEAGLLISAVAKGSAVDDMRYDEVFP